MVPFNSRKAINVSPLPIGFFSSSLCTGAGTGLCTLRFSLSRRSILSFSTNIKIRRFSAISSSRSFFCSAIYFLRAGVSASRRALSRAKRSSRSFCSWAWRAPCCASIRALRSAKRAAGVLGLIGGGAADGKAARMAVVN